MPYLVAQRCRVIQQRRGAFGGQARALRGGQQEVPVVDVLLLREVALRHRVVEDASLTPPRLGPCVRTRKASWCFASAPGKPNNTTGGC